MFTKEKAYALADEYASRNLESDDSFSRSAVLGFLELIEERNLFAVPRKAGSGRKDGLTKKKVVEILRHLTPAHDQDESEIIGLQFKGYPRHYLERIVAMGYLEKRNVQTGTKGRPPVEYVLTGKGRGYLALSKNWKMA